MSSVLSSVTVTAFAIAMTVTLHTPKQPSNPVLKLEGLEHRVGERMTIEVVDAKHGTVLGTTALIGSNHPDANAPMETMDLIVPLNDNAARVMAKKNKVTLTLRLVNPRRGTSLKVKRVYFETSGD